MLQVNAPPLHVRVNKIEIYSLQQHISESEIITKVYHTHWYFPCDVNIKLPLLVQPNVPH